MKKLWIVLAFVLCVPFLLAGGENVEEAADSENGGGEYSENEKAVVVPESTDASQFVIGRVSYTISGKTRKDVLQYYLDIEEGKLFKRRKALEAYLLEKEQLIENQRTLSEGEISASYRQDSNDSDRVYVDIDIYVEDTWNYIVLPYARYDSNEGFLLSLRGRNYNFLGGMERLGINIDYLRTVKNENEFALAIDFKIPFYLGGKELTFSMEEEVEYTPEEPVKAYTGATVTFDVPTEFQTWQAEITQEYYLNEEYESESDPDPDGYYMMTLGRFGSSIPTGVELPVLGEFSYNPGLISSVSYKPGGSLSNQRKGYDAGLDHSLSAGRIDWEGNYRKGMDFSLSHTHKYNFTRQLWVSDLDLTCEAHAAFDKIGISSRLVSFYSHTRERSNEGKNLRGIIDKRIEGQAGVMLNVAVPVKMWMWFLSDWFEGHVSPFFDYGLTKPEDGGFDQDWYGAGIELIGFPKFARSLYARISLGIDAEAMVRGGGITDPTKQGFSRYEIYIGLGHHY